MASKYLQKYPIPSGFPQILSDFTREVLRDQPTNIIQYASKYFEMLEKGKSLDYDSKYNVHKNDKKYELAYNPKNAAQITKKASNIASALSQAPNIQQAGPKDIQIEDEEDQEQEEAINNLVDMYYEIYDTNKNDFFQKDQINKLATVASQQLGLGTPSEEKLQKFRKALDMDGDGKISKQEFKKQVTSLIDFTRKHMK